jgi:hypothetical protein
VNPRRIDESPPPANSLDGEDRFGLGKAGAVQRTDSQVSCCAPVSPNTQEYHTPIDDLAHSRATTTFTKRETRSGSVGPADKRGRVNQAEKTTRHNSSHDVSSSG